MGCGGMCTHGEVLLQRVSVLLLQVDRREVGRGCGRDGNSARVDDETRRHQHEKQQQRGKVWQWNGNNSLKKWWIWFI